jgi:aryl-alcohol dehydrogenase-like predicted oxidoreductase
MALSRRDALATLPVLASSLLLPEAAARKSSGLRRRKLGRTGIEVSELGFGGAGIGGNSFGAVSEREAFDTLAAAHDLGCNFIDTARIYGQSELVLGKFLRKTRHRWIVATKYSGQKAGMRVTLEEQLTRLQVEAVDIYQIHWVPKGNDAELYDELYALRKEGKVRCVGVSASSHGDVDYVLARTQIDTVQLPFNLLEPEPMKSCVGRMEEAGLGVIARSVLREGYLTGKFKAAQAFDPQTDVRSALKTEEQARRLAEVEKFRFLQEYDASLTSCAIRYALSFAGISTAIIGTKTREQAAENFSGSNSGSLPEEALSRIATVQGALQRLD